MIEKVFLNIIHNKLIADNIYELLLESTENLNNAKPGQFLHICCSDGIDPLLRRPLSICDINENQITIIYRSQGKGTSWLAKQVPGKKIDVLGPLGNGFPIEQHETALLVGGGVGVPPLYFLGKELKKLNINVITLLGFQNKKDVFYEEKFSELGKTFVSTVDGSYGHHGYVTNLMTDQKIGDWNSLFSCGPTPMLKALQGLLDSSHRPAFLSLEERMGCGLGACLACVCKPKDLSKNKYLKVCSDGPVFKMSEVLL